MTRYIGIRHRTKGLVETSEREAKEARPTQVCLLDGKITCLNLETETDELDFLLGRFPVEWRPVEPDENVGGIFPRHLKTRKVKKGEDLSSLHPSQLIKSGKESEVVIKVATAFEGFRTGDKVAMVLGGSGDKFGYAIARRGEEINCELVRIAPARIKSSRPDPDNKDEDASLLARLVKDEPDLFQPISPREMNVIIIRHLYELRMDAMKDRLACEQRIFQRLIGRIFFMEDGRYPEGNIEDLYAAEKANDRNLQALQAVEDECMTKLAQAVKKTDVWQKLFASIEGVGPRIAAPIIALIGDIRRFPTEAKFRAYCGVAPDREGKFRRRRKGEVANWSGDIRQTLWLLYDQCVRRPDSTWGQVMLAEKARLRQVHPEVVEEKRPVKGRPGQFKTVKLYTNGHIHNMARWSTMAKFCNWLYAEWNTLYSDGMDEATETEENVA